MFIDRIIQTSCSSVITVTGICGRGMICTEDEEEDDEIVFTTARSFDSDADSSIRGGVRASGRGFLRKLSTVA